MAQGRDADLRGAGEDLTERRPGASTFVIFNPASGRGRGGRDLRLWLDLLGRHLPGVEHAVTTRPAHEAELAERAIAQGFTTIVAAGGDGTWSHVADRLLSSGKPGLRFGLLPSGTGNDFGRNLGLSRRSPEEAVRVLARAEPRAVDVGRVLTPSVRADRPDAEFRAPRYFLNVVGFGFDVAVIDAARGARFLRGELLYKVTALQQLFRFPGFQVQVADAEGGRRSGRQLMLTVSNGCFFGGGFPIAPGATVDDGQLHACLIGDAGPWERFRLFNLAEKGRHVRSPRVALQGSTVFHIRSQPAPRFEIDGDVYRSAGEEVTVEVIPGALQVMAAPSSRQERAAGEGSRA